MHDRRRARPGFAAALFWLFLPLADLRAEESSAADPVRLSIAASDDLRPVLAGLLAAFKARHGNIEVQVSHGTSNGLFSEILYGAPFDVFLSASAPVAQKLVQQGFSLEPSPVKYGVARLALWVPRSSALDLERDGLRALLDDSVQHIALLDRTQEPYGSATLAALEGLGLRDAVLSKLLPAENILQASASVQSGRAEIAILPLSEALGPDLREQGRFWPLPLDAHPWIEHSAVLLGRTKVPEAARQFVAFLTGPEGQALLQRHGFTDPGNLAQATPCVPGSAGCR